MHCSACKVDQTGIVKLCSYHGEFTIKLELALRGICGQTTYPSMMMGTKFAEAITQGRLVLRDLDTRA